MKLRHMAWKRTLALTFLVLGPVTFDLAEAQCPVVSGSTGANGAFNPTSNTTLPLPPDGVLNFTTVNIPQNVTVTFERNARNTPVVLLATGNVTIAGTIDLKGEDANGPDPGRGGPGGFDGGAGGIRCGGPGLGPRGGSAACDGFSGGGGGSGVLNEKLVPLVGGSGGGGAGGVTGFGSGGGGGGGAIVIASSGTLTLNGVFSIPGGSGHNPGAGGFRIGGSGGSGVARFLATSVAGSGFISAGGSRMEACSGQFNGSGVTSFSPMPSPVIIANLPELSITSVGGFAVPTDPNGAFSGAPDVSLPEGTTEAEVELTASGVPLGTRADVKVTPRNGPLFTAQSTQLAGSLESSTAMATVTLTPGRSIVTAEVTVTVSGREIPVLRN